MVNHKYTDILKEELVLAAGCTEPVALAYLAAVAHNELNGDAKKIKVYCSANIVKNVKGVTIPNTDGLKGIEAAVIVGYVVNDPKKEMEILKEVNDQQKTLIKQLLAQNIVEIICLHDEPSLSVKIEMINDQDKIYASLMHTHTNITLIKKNDQIIYENYCDSNDYNSVLIDRSILNIDDIFDYVENIDLTQDITDLLDKQISANMAIAEEGLRNKYGAQVGKVILNNLPGDLFKGIAYASAASDARMSGCKLAVMTNSGSGNQGITASLPVIIYAQENKLTQEKLYRALLLSNLITIHIKTGIGRLSAYCGVVCAATASFAAIGYLSNYSKEGIKKVIKNSLATSSGIICDGAKESCASKISTALFSALLALKMVNEDICFESTCGIVKNDVEEMIDAVGYIGREGMRSTDKVVLDVMINHE